MARTVLYMSVSVDGFVAGPHDETVPLGEGGHRLHAWLRAPGEEQELALDQLTGADEEVMAEVMATGAVLVGRRTFEHAGGFDGDHHDGVPVFVVSRRPAGPDQQWPGVTFVDDLATAVRLAKEAAGDRDVLVHGATLAQLALDQGLLDELQLHLVPVLLGRGRRQFAELTDQVELDLVSTRQGDGVTHLRFRVAG